MIVKIMDYGDAGDGKFIDYEVVGLAPDQREFLNANLEEETSIDGESLKLRMFFSEDLYPFQSDVAKYRLDDFIAREEIEMNVFLSSILEDM